MSELIAAAWTDGEGGQYSLEIWPISYDELVKQLEDKTRHIHVKEAIGARCRTMLSLNEEKRIVFAVWVTLPKKGTRIWDSALRQWDIPGPKNTVDPDLFCEEIKDKE